MPTPPRATRTPDEPSSSPAVQSPVAVNEMVLTARQWCALVLTLVLTVQLAPWVWEKLERFDTGADYRIPYPLSKDYWLYGRRLRSVPRSEHIVVLGDSVVWEEDVLPDGTLSHFLNQEAGESNRFVNAGVNGLFPLALEGLVNHYGQAVHDRKVILHCNLLWMTSPKADLTSEKEERFNHAQLVPQFSPRIPCYKADANTRLTAVVERNVRFLQWVNHLQSAYFGEKNIPTWTLADDESGSLTYPNAWKNPLAQIRLTVPPAPREDPQRGPKSARHKPWSAAGAGLARFEWVALEKSLQWRACQGIIQTLQRRGNDVMVILGPFNESMITADDQRKYRKLRDEAALWFAQQGVAHLLPEPLPSALYADASHPLTEGYQLLAQRLYQDAAFRKWATATGAQTR